MWLSEPVERSDGRGPCRHREETGDIMRRTGASAIDVADTVSSTVARGDIHHEPDLCLYQGHAYPLADVA